MKTLILLVLLAASASAQSTAGAPPQAPKYRTARDFKILWYNQFEIPSQLHREYRGAVEARNAFVSRVRTGALDLDAEHAAAAHNARIALAAGDAEKATYYQGEVARIDAKMAEIRKAKQTERLIGQLEALNSRPVCCP